MLGIHKVVLDDLKNILKIYCPHLYGDYSYAIIDDVRKLPEKLSRLYLRRDGSGFRFFIIINNHYIGSAFFIIS